ncbi:SCO1664 family protein [Nocardia sp. alder85J]|uniref:SCO1664 family protein n=1 Tax=Nocardia sp. alder85J TaxID=2862949 RepID=UPI001CD2FA7C|nr:SCO1664 family protein [Nocardia sp. alder85J]MCX4092878.1 SCO1664 family protein [Nocardia sp. alder85J]
MNAVTVLGGDGAADPFYTGDLSVLGQVSTASNLTLVCEITADGTVRDAGRRARADRARAGRVYRAAAGESMVRVVYKPVRGERPLWDFPDGTLAGREVASYLVSQALGWPVIPETILRDGPYGVGMVQRWIQSPEVAGDPDDAQVTQPRPDLVDLVPAGAVPEGFLEVLRAVDGTGAEVSLVHADDPRLYRMAVLDVLINNADRKGGHALAGVDGGVYGVDHGICLHAEPKLRTVLWGWAGSPVDADLLDDIAGLLPKLSGGVGDALAEHITDEEIQALAARTRRLLADPVMPLPRSSRPIPWPAF